jgi:hypothetical protein
MAIIRNVWLPFWRLDRSCGPVAVAKFASRCSRSRCGDPLKVGVSPLPSVDWMTMSNATLQQHDRINSTPMPQPLGSTAHRRLYLQFISAWQNDNIQKQAKITSTNALFYVDESGEGGDAPPNPLAEPLASMDPISPLPSEAPNAATLTLPLATLVTTGAGTGSGDPTTRSLNSRHSKFLSSDTPPKTAEFS